jgi:hypothetical protein
MLPATSRTARESLAACLLLLLASATNRRRVESLHHMIDAHFAPPFGLVIYRMQERWSTIKETWSKDPRVTSRCLALRTFVLCKPLHSRPLNISSCIVADRAECLPSSLFGRHQIQAMVMSFTILGSAIIVFGDDIMYKFPLLSPSMHLNPTHRHLGFHLC